MVSVMPAEVMEHVSDQEAHCGWPWSLGGHLEARVSQGEDNTDYEGCKEAARVSGHSVTNSDR